MPHIRLKFSLVAIPALFALFLAFNPATSSAEGQAAGKSHEMSKEHMKHDKSMCAEKMGEMSQEQKDKMAEMGKKHMGEMGENHTGEMPEMCKEHMKKMEEKSGGEAEGDIKADES